MSSFIRRAGTALLKLIEQAGDPGGLTDRIFLYGKDAAGITQLYAQASDGTVYQLTPPTAALAQIEFFGTAVDAALNFDGINVVVGATRVGTTYTLTRDIYPSSMIIAAGVDITNGGFVIHCQGAITMSGSGTAKIHRNGIDGSAGGSGAQAAGTLPAANGGNSGGGSGSNGASATASNTVPVGMVVGAPANGGAIGAVGTNGGIGQGGGGGGSASNSGGNGGTTAADGTTTVAWMARCLFDGRALVNAPLMTCGTGGGGGAGVTGVANGGRGGGAGGWVVVTAYSIASTISIEAKGGAGNVTGNGCGGGGGGSGGVVVVQVTIGPVPTTDVSAGAGAAGIGVGKHAGDGGAGLAFAWSLF